MTAPNLTIDDFLNLSRQELLVDVRAPIEFNKGHLPGAVNIPLFEDFERAEIGTLFKQQGKDTAVTRGLEIVSPKMVSFVNRVRQLSKNKKVFVYCFRGGMRSNSFAWLMNTSGLDAQVLKGGYKCYRNHVLGYFTKPQQVILLGGHTGSGKTDILKYLAQQGVQTVDLEKLANHKGSAFGAINEEKQPSQQNFEHRLYQAFMDQDASKPVLLEDESKSIGFNKIPHPLWLQMKLATIVKLEIPFELRIENLVKDYATTDTEALKACVIKIAQQLGPLHTKQCMQYLDEGNLHDTARLTLQYYDKVYGYTYSQKQQPIIPVVSDTMDVAINAQKVKQIIDFLTLTMNYKLTQYSKASGCGCKIAPAVLEEILKGTAQSMSFKNLLVGNETKDDAAVFELENGNCIISTTDFFTPIVDDPFDFGKISACNAISDVYAMGGKPLMAVAILGWPVDKIPVEAAQLVIKGAQEICSAAGIPLAGGHSVDTQEPLFGLAVTGHIQKENLKKNNTVKEQDVLYLTKPLGTGILSAALKREKLAPEDYTMLLGTASTLNSIGEKAGQLPYVNAMTDVTGFGFAGHLLEMLEGNDVSAVIEKENVPVMSNVKNYMSQFIFPDNTTRNFNAQSAHIEGMTDLDFMLYCDPQTSGGLLISVDKQHEADMDAFLKINGQFFSKVGQITSRKEKKIVFV